jgi:hypothetical protein
MASLWPLRHKKKLSKKVFIKNKILQIISLFTSTQIHTIFSQEILHNSVTKQIKGQSSH